MSVREAMEKYDQAMQPVYDAIDAAMRVIGDPESVGEGVERHLSWWTEELVALADEQADR